MMNTVTGQLKFVVICGKYSALHHKSVSHVYHILDEPYTVFHLDSNKGTANGDPFTLQAVKAGLLKILSKMGISLLTR